MQEYQKLILPVNKPSGSSHDFLFQRFRQKVANSLPRSQLLKTAMPRRRLLMLENTENNGTVTQPKLNRLW